MTRYRKKPVIIEAVQMTETLRWDLRSWPTWLTAAWNKSSSAVGSMYPDPSDATKAKLCIRTAEGVQNVAWNDFIIQDVLAGLFPCKPDIFKLTYMPFDKAADLAAG